MWALLIRGLIWAISSAIGDLAIRALIGVGVGFASYKVVVEPVRNAIQARLDSAGVLADYVGWLGIDVAITIVLSAVIARAAVGSMKAHLVKKR